MTSLDIMTFGAFDNNNTWGFFESAVTPTVTPAPVTPAPVTPIIPSNPENKTPAITITSEQCVPNVITGEQCI